MSQSKRQDCFCAYCKNKRKVYTSKHLDASAVAGFVLLSVIFSYLVWQGLDASSLMILGILMVVGEMFSRLRWRQAINCIHCGFDPILYKQSPELAANKIREFIAEKSQKPEYLLRPQVKPPIKEMPKEPTAKRGENLSLQG